LERKMSFWALKSGETQSEEEYGGHPQDIAFLDETEKWRTSREHLHREDHSCLRNLVPEPM
jgi:hypothetical protein